MQDGFVKLGIRISLFYLTKIELDQDISIFESNKFSDYTVELLNEKDLDNIAAFQKGSAQKEYYLRLQDGCIGFGVKKNGDIVAYTWFNFLECTFAGYRFKLKENEAYAFDTYTFIEYRGKRIAPFLFYQSNKKLIKLGRTTLYSIVEVLNKQAVNVYRKLGARFVLLALYISLFKKWNFTIPLKRYIPESICTK
jgi:hypothetical protein